MFTTFIMLFSSFFPLLGYLKSQSFPTPLTEDEEKEMLERLSNGDKEARRILIEHNLRLIAHIIKKYESNHYPSDDLISIGTIGLIKAVDTYDANKQNKLTTYAARCIENEILMHLRSNKKSLNDISLQDPIGYDKDGNEISLVDVIDSETTINVTDLLYKREQYQKLYQYIDTLEDKEKEIIIMRYGLNNQTPLTQRQIAEEKNISRSYVAKLEKRAFVKLLKLFNSK